MLQINSFSFGVGVANSDLNATTVDLVIDRAVKAQTFTPFSSLVVVLQRAKTNKFGEVTVKYYETSGNKKQDTLTVAKTLFTHIVAEFCVRNEFESEFKYLVSENNKAFKNESGTLVSSDVKSKADYKAFGKATHIYFTDKEGKVCNTFIQLDKPLKDTKLFPTLVGVQTAIENKCFKPYIHTRCKAMLSESSILTRINEKVETINAEKVLVPTTAPKKATKAQKAKQTKVDKVTVSETETKTAQPA